MWKSLSFLKENSDNKKVKNIIILCQIWIFSSLAGCAYLFHGEEIQIARQTASTSTGANPRANVCLSALSLSSKLQGLSDRRFVSLATHLHDSWFDFAEEMRQRDPVFVPVLLGGGETPQKAYERLHSPLNLKDYLLKDDGGEAQLYQNINHPYQKLLPELAQQRAEKDLGEMFEYLKAMGSESFQIMDEKVIQAILKHFHEIWMKNHPELRSITPGYFVDVSKLNTQVQYSYFLVLDAFLRGSQPSFFILVPSIGHYAFVQYEENLASRIARNERLFEATSALTRALERHTREMAEIDGGSNRNAYVSKYQQLEEKAQRYKDTLQFSRLVGLLSAGLFINFRDTFISSRLPIPGSQESDFYRMNQRYPGISIVIGKASDSQGGSGLEQDIHKKERRYSELAPKIAQHYFEHPAQKLFYLVSGADEDELHNFPQLVEEVFKIWRGDFYYLGLYYGLKFNQEFSTLSPQMRIHFVNILDLAMSVLHPRIKESVEYQQFIERETAQYVEQFEFPKTSEIAFKRMGDIIAQLSEKIDEIQGQLSGAEGTLDAAEKAHLESKKSQLVEKRDRYQRLIDKSDHFPTHS